MAEKRDSIVQGFVHSVSSVQLSKKTHSPYFNFTMQTSREEFHRGVVYSPEKHAAFQHAATEKSPVKLRNVRKTQNTGNSFQVVVNRHSSLETAQVSFRAQTPSSERNMPLDEVNKLGPFERVVEIHVKVVSMSLCSTMANVRGTDTELRDCFIADSTFKLKLTLWEDQIKSVDVGQSYTITHTATRSQGGAIHLTCTKATVFKRIANVVVLDTVVAATEPQEQLMTAVGEITGVHLTDRRMCPQCGGRQSTLNAKAKHHRCETCKMLRKSSTYTANMSGTVVMTCAGVEDRCLTLPMSVLSCYLQGAYLSYLLTDVEDVKEHFLGGTFHFTHSKGSMLTEITRMGTMDDRPSGYLCSSTSAHCC